MTGPLHAEILDTLVWELENAPEPVLRIGALPGQLDVLEAIFAPSHPTP